MRELVLALILIFAFSTSSCSSSVEEAEVSYLHYMKKSELTIGLDSTTVDRSARFQVFSTSDSSVEFLAFINEIESSIKVYRFDSLEGPERTIHFETGEGPNTIGGPLAFFDILSLDSLLTYVEFSEGSMSIMSPDGKRHDSFRLPTLSSLSTNYYPGFSNSSPIFKLDNDRLLFPYSVSKVNGEGKAPLFTYNMKSDKVSYGLRVLRNYENLNSEKIGGKEFFKVSITYNSNDNTYSIIRPLDSKIYVVSPEMELLKSIEFKDPDQKEFKTLNKPYKSYRSNEKRFLYHRYGNSRFTSIIYDPWKKVYYRILNLGYSKDQIDKIVDDGIRVYPDFKISVFNSSFDMILNYHVDGAENISLDEFFVYSGGLAMKKMVKSDEDLMKFQVYDILEK